MRHLKMLNNVLPLSKNVSLTLWPYVVLAKVLTQYDHLCNTIIYAKDHNFFVKKWNNSIWSFPVLRPYFSCIKEILREYLFQFYWNIEAGNILISYCMHRQFKEFNIRVPLPQYLNLILWEFPVKIFTLIILYILKSWW